MDPRHRLRKTSGWCNEQCVRQVMALNKKEQSNLQQKLDQVQWKQNQLRRGFDYDIWKTRQAFNARKNVPRTSGDPKSRAWRKRLPFVKPNKPNKAMTNTNRRYSISCATPVRIVEECERDGKKADEDVMSEIDNSFKFLSIAFGNRPSTPTSSNIVKLQK